MSMSEPPEVPMLGTTTPTTLLQARAPHPHIAPMHRTHAHATLTAPGRHTEAAAPSSVGHALGGGTCAGRHMGAAQGRHSGPVR